MVGPIGWHDAGQVFSVESEPTKCTWNLRERERERNQSVRLVKEEEGKDTQEGGSKLVTYPTTGKTRLDVTADIKRFPRERDGTDSLICRVIKKIKEKSFSFSLSLSR